MERKRVVDIKKYVTALYCILPFEKDFFAKHRIIAEYNGHPLLEHINNFKKTTKISKKFFNKNRLNNKNPIISLIPGSRKQEIIKKLPIMIEACSNFLSNYNIVIAGMNSLKIAIPTLLAKSGISIVYDTYNLLNHSTYALVTSRTATLETAFFNIPQVVAYKTSWISYKIAKSFVKVKYISLVNLILNKPIVKELIQSELNIKTLTKELSNLKNEKIHDQIKLEYSNLHSIS